LAWIGLLFVFPLMLRMVQSPPRGKVVLDSGLARRGRADGYPRFGSRRPIKGVAVMQRKVFRKASRTLRGCPTARLTFSFSYLIVPKALGATETALVLMAVSGWLELAVFE
jgi:hypothetical protein